MTDILESLASFLKIGSLTNTNTAAAFIASALDALSLDDTIKKLLADTETALVSGLPSLSGIVSSLPSISDIIGSLPSDVSIGGIISGFFDDIVTYITDGIDDIVEAAKSSIKSRVQSMTFALYGGAS